VDREASEKAFLEAYDHLLENRLWNCLDSLDETLRLNTYFIDAYYVRSLALRKMGRYADAIRAMSSYLEVRYDDYRARIILDSMKSQHELLSGALFPNNAPSGLYFERRSTSAFFNVPLYDKLAYAGMRGLGKISAAYGIVFVCDTRGDGVWFSDRSGRARTGRFDIGKPVAAAPLNPQESLIFQKSGDVGRLFIDTESWSVRYEDTGVLSAGMNVSDGIVIDSTLALVTDSTGQAVRFYSLPSLDLVASWSPADRDQAPKIFEPVAAAARGSFAAVADRGNGMVYVLDSYTLAVLDSFSVDLPRDLEWGSDGDLLVVSENGRLYRRFPIASSDTAPDLVSEGMKEAWSIAWTEDGPILSDVSGRIWWDGGIRPAAGEAFGALNLHSPWIDESGQDGVPRLILRASAASVFQRFINGRTPDTQAVWRGETRPSSVSTVSAESSGTIFYYSPNPSDNIVNAGVRPAVTITDVIDDIAAASRSGEPLPKALILDTRLSGTNGEMEALFALALQNGMRVDLWALKRPPSVLLARVSQAALGQTYYSPALDNVPLGGGAEWLLSVPLPPDYTTYGYPSDATLSVLGTVDVINFADWIPIWPSMLRRAPQE
jgi:tetratricopeptide (TPR) repeat protein